MAKFTTFHGLEVADAEARKSIEQIKSNNPFLFPTKMNANLWINYTAYTKEYLETWFENVNAIGIKNITLVIVGIYDNDVSDFKLRASNFELLDEYIEKYNFEITQIKFSNTLVGSGKFADYTVDFTKSDIRTKYVNFVKNTLQQMVNKYPTIEKCYAINEANYWYNPNNENYTSEKLEMCISIINACNSIMPSSISFAYVNDYYDADETLKTAIKSSGVIGINYYQKLNNVGNHICGLNEAYETWKNNSLDGMLISLKNEGFTDINLSETGIDDYYEQLHSMEETGTKAYGKGQIVYYGGLLKWLQENNILNSVSLWYADKLYIENKRLIDIFNSFKGGYKE